MSALILQHEPHEPAARLGSVLREYGLPLRVIRLFAGDPIPPDVDGLHAIISLGGAANIHETARYAWIAPELQLLKLAHGVGLPLVGLCLGAQLIAACLGGEVSAMPAAEVGWHPVTLSFPGTTDPLLAGLPWQTMQFHLHGQEVKKLPAGAVSLASSKACKVQGFRAGLTTYGFQFHFEWSLSEISAAASDPLFAGAGRSSPQLDRGTERHLAAYGRLGERLCHNIAQYLLAPVRQLVA